MLDTKNKNPCTFIDVHCTMFKHGLDSQGTKGMNWKDGAGQKKKHISCQKKEEQ